MLAFVIALSIAFMIFIITSIVVIVRRKQKATRNVGYVISDGAPANVPSGFPVYQSPPPGYQTNVYPATYAYPVQNISHVQMQMPMQMSGMPAPTTGMNATNPCMIEPDAPTVLPSNSEKPVTHQSHQGAVESVSQI